MTARTLATALLFLAPAALVAQEQAATLDYCSETSPPEAARFTFTSPSDFERFPLCGGVKYLVETNRGGLRLDLRPIAAGVAPPFVREGLPGATVQGGQSWIVDVPQTGIFELRTRGFQSGAPVEIIVTPRLSDEQEEARRDAEDERRAREKAEKQARKDAEKAAEKARKEQEKARKAAAEREG